MCVVRLSPPCRCAPLAPICPPAPSPAPPHEQLLIERAEQWRRQMRSVVANRSALKRVRSFCPRLPPLPPLPPCCPCCPCWAPALKPPMRALHHAPPTAPAPDSRRPLSSYLSPPADALRFPGHPSSPSTDEGGVDRGAAPASGAARNRGAASGDQAVRRGLQPGCCPSAACSGARRSRLWRQPACTPPITAPPRWQKLGPWKPTRIYLSSTPQAGVGGCNEACGGRPPKHAGIPH